MLVDTCEEETCKVEKDEEDRDEQPHSDLESKHKQRPARAMGPLGMWYGRCCEKIGFSSEGGDENTITNITDFTWTRPQYQNFQFFVISFVVPQQQQVCCC